MSKRAIITGITGQDGSYLAELLLDKGYEVFGVTRRLSSSNYWRIEHLLGRLELRAADLLDELSLIRVISEVRPQELYNLGAMSFVPASWAQPLLTGEFNAQGVTRVLEAVRHVDPSIRVYQASSSESYGLYACSGILFNHESPRRGLEFVTRKVTDAVARIKCGLADKLSLGNLAAQRDWGFAGDYVRAMWMMLQQPSPDDYVIATGVSHSVQDLVEVAFGHVGLNWRDYVGNDPAMIRPAEVDHLIGDATKAHQALGWKPEVDFASLVRMMVDADLARHRAATA